jgi:hypothetical protein
MQHNTSVQVWVKIFGLAQEYWHKNILFTIAGSLGTPICIDAVTAKPMHERTFGQFARVLVDIDLLQPLRYKLLVERKGYAFFVDLEYEHIPDFCTECKMIGHNIGNCYRWKKEEELKGIKENNTRQKVPEKKKVYVPVNDGRMQTSNPTASNVEKEIINVEDTSTKSPHHDSVGIHPNNVNGSMHREQEEAQSHQRNEVNTGPILEPVSPKSLSNFQDKQLENELNEDSEDWCTESQDSVVKDSQEIADISINEAGTEENNGKAAIVDNTPTPTIPIAGETSRQDAPTPTRVAKDMAFLKESWANMVEAEDEADHNIADTNLHDDGFQIHMSKNQKKAQKKVKQSSRDSYATRSRVPPKPFK